MAKGHDLLLSVDNGNLLYCDAVAMIIVANSLNYTLELGECFVCLVKRSSLQLEGSLVEAYRFSYCSACVILVS